MSCPRWPRLTAWRRGDGPAPPGWGAALAHLDECETCRREVAALDPLLLLAAAPEPPVSDGEIDSMRATVTALRRVSLVASPRRAGRRQRTLAAALLAAALLLVPSAGRRPSDPTAVPEPGGAGTTLSLLPEAPAVEEVHPAEARVYRLGSEELPVVLIVAESFDL